MAFQATHGMTLSVNEPVTTGVDFAAAPVVTHNGLSTPPSGVVRNPSSTPPVSKHSAKIFALVAGAGTVDLTNLPGVDGSVVNLTGQKVALVMLKTPASNAAPITVKIGATNGYALDGAGFQFTMGPGEQRLIDKFSNAPAVGPTAKTIDFAGTGTDVIDYQIVGG